MELWAVDIFADIVLPLGRVILAHAVEHAQKGAEADEVWLTRPIGLGGYHEPKCVRKNTYTMRALGAPYQRRCGADLGWRINRRKLDSVHFQVLRSVG